jgi:hypothetical protein
MDKIKEEVLSLGGFSQNEKGERARKEERE